VSGSSYTKLNGSLVAGAVYTDSSVQNATTYYYVTTAVDSTGAESSFSNEAQAIIP
jgi:TolB protein